MTDRTNTDPLPRFPRDLSPKAQRALAVQWAKDVTENDVRALQGETAEPVTGWTRGFFELSNINIIRHTWADERITELETKLAGALKKIALLSRRLEEITDDA